MGRKKAGKKEKKTRSFTIPRVFDCEKCSETKKERTKRQAKIFCVKCKYVGHQDVEILDQAIDVYNKWCTTILGNNLKNKGEEEDDDDKGSDIDIDDLEENEFYH